MRRELELKLKTIVPAPLGRTLRMIDNYRRRLTTWTQVARQIKGDGPEDRWRLWSAFAAAPVTSLRDLYGWQNPELRRDATVRVRGVGKFRLRANSDDLYHVLPTREREVTSIIAEYLRAGDTFVDAGANIGFFTILASHVVGPTGKVIAVEMMPDTAEILRSHVVENDRHNIVVVENALSSKSGNTVAATVHVGHYGMASIVSGEGSSTIHVTTRTIDDILKDVDRVTLMKMDLEKAEALALRGAQQSLRKIDAILFEQFPDEDPTPATILTDSGFRIRRVSPYMVLAEQPRSLSVAR